LTEASRRLALVWSNTDHERVSQIRSSDPEDQEDTIWTLIEAVSLSGGMSRLGFSNRIRSLAAFPARLSSSMPRFPQAPGSSTMNVFDLRDQLSSDYARFIQGFIQIRDQRIAQIVEQSFQTGRLIPPPLIQLNPSFESGRSIEELVEAGLLSSPCLDVFRADKTAADRGRPMRLHHHQDRAVEIARTGDNYVLTTGTGSGKSLAYMVPIVDSILREGGNRGIRAIVVYPMNALANSQLGELAKFCSAAPFTEDRPAVRFARYTGQENAAEKAAIIQQPPDILFTNYVMLELMLTRQRERPLIERAKGLQFIVFDELHTYRGRQGSDVALLIRRLKEQLEARNLQHIGTSATMSSEGSPAERRAKVAEIATQIFGATVKPEHVIGEKLRRQTSEVDFAEEAARSRLADRVRAGSPPPKDAASFLADPLSSWIESTLGVRPEADGSGLARAQPRAIEGERGAAMDLAETCKVPREQAENLLRAQLMAGYQVRNVAGRPSFVFRLHQFVSRGDTVYASLEGGPHRFLTLEMQRSDPSDAKKRLFPLVFCRECGHEYYSVRRFMHAARHANAYEPRELNDLTRSDDSEPGYLFAPNDGALEWPDGDHAAPSVVERVPEDWTEEGARGVRVRSGQRKYLPLVVHVGADGVESVGGLRAAWIGSPFKFCPCCGVSYRSTRGSDRIVLGEIGFGGRSSATTLLTTSAVKFLRTRSDLPQTAQKVLSFTDNRQDASLQSGHFNDYVQIALMRAGLRRAAEQAGSEGLSAEDLARCTQTAMQVPFDAFSKDHAAEYDARDEIEKTFRQLVLYRLFVDMERGWRLAMPNLEQLGLLRVEYASLDRLCGDEQKWANAHVALQESPPEVRARICKVLLDYLRRELVVDIDCLAPDFEERFKQRVRQHLSDAWSAELGLRMQVGRFAIPRAQIQGGGTDRDVFVSPRGSFGTFLRRRQFKERGLSTNDCEAIIRDLFDRLSLTSLKRTDGSNGPRFQIRGTNLRWHASDLGRGFHCPLRIPNPPAGGMRVNPYWTEFYRTGAAGLAGLEAREHTAQVQDKIREDREQSFREGKLPVLFCSPTMELGVDIADLNVVNLRNVPPTPANYAQRSGRAGRSGQPALVTTFCAAGSSHDQYFFRRQERVVAGSVTPPKLDLANAELIRAHIHAIWLSASRLSLEEAMSRVINVDDAELPLQESVAAALRDTGARDNTLRRARHMLEGVRTQLVQAGWYSEEWLQETVSQIPGSFEQACRRWRDLFKAATGQQRIQNERALNNALSADDRRRATRLRAEAESQRNLLLNADPRSGNLDFNPYRYLASEGFLPGYNFPRLPLSAFIPGKAEGGEDSWLNRARFLAISEFGPRSIIYHEGARFEIVQAILPPGEQGVVAFTSAKQCPACGALYEVRAEQALDLCRVCNGELDAPMNELLRLANVRTRKRERINCDEEERLRQGYDVRTAISVPAAGALGGMRSTVMSSESTLAELTYLGSAQLWRINRGWKRRGDQNRLGFPIDTTDGRWLTDKDVPQDGADAVPDAEDGEAAAVPGAAYVIPFVSDTRNALLLRPEEALPLETMASLQAALKRAIQAVFQLEDQELAVEPLPTPDLRRQILIYEASEGGAGVLRRLQQEEAMVHAVARKALEICHFDPDTGADLKHAPNSREDCSSACYDCLMSYSNQPDHGLLDRHRTRDFLLQLRSSRLRVAPGERPRAEHLKALRDLADGELERRFIDWLELHRLRLPSYAQFTPPELQECYTRPDFIYESERTVVYIDGPHHRFPDRAKRDQEQVARVKTRGWSVLRFAADADWMAIVQSYPVIFGAPA
jgi:superfamily II DNA/RNA helicase/very-short-patch-repair endonuclease